ncbi:MAG: hypothetical protein OXC46_06520 [Thaumarchaeota archaeon]|nr:hypothetical protein [Nitrososphaerota archaeon]
MSKLDSIWDAPYMISYCKCPRYTRVYALQSMGDNRGISTDKCIPRNLDIGIWSGKIGEN